MGDKMSATERAELFRQTSETKAARSEFAMSWAAMINEVLPVETTVRSIFTVEQLDPLS